MAEVMILLIFCLLIALAAYLKLEKAQLRQLVPGAAKEDVSLADSSLYERLSTTSASTNPKAIDEFWRDLVTNQSLADDYKELGLTTEKARERLTYAEKLEAKGIDVQRAAQAVDIVGSIQKLMPADSASQLTPKQTIIETIQRGLKSESGTGHQWPPIITLSEANGYYFKTGSAELSPRFKLELTTSTPERIVDLIKQYDVNVIEVVGHTDEQPIASRPSNLDSNLPSVLKGSAAVGSLVPADNAGLGLARAVSVVSILRQSKLLESYKLIPLSGAQLVNTDETLDIGATPGDIPQRRRIEIRLRKSSSAANLIPVPRPKRKSIARPKPDSPNLPQQLSSPLQLGPAR
jgi:flagellar motor protein MotB